MRYLVQFLIPASLLAVQYPSGPQMPNVSEPKIDGAARPGGRRPVQKAEKVAQVGVRLKIHLGDKSVLMAETQIPSTYSFTHRKGQVQYNQTVRAEDIRELAIESYRSRRISSGKEGEVFEFEPAAVRIEL